MVKVRRGQPLGDSDITELQEILMKAGIGDEESFATATERAGRFGLGRFAKLQARRCERLTVSSD